MGPVDQYIREQLRPFYQPHEIAALSRIVCCEILGQSHVDYFLGKDMDLSTKQKENLASVLCRLRNQEPIQYIQQCAWFQRRQFYVDSSVLIPRSETGELVERVVRMVPPQSRLLDIGTGSGCIAVTLSKELPDAQVDAWDISAEALAVAQRNNDNLGAHVRFSQVDVLSYSPAVSQVGTYDVVISNPPYITPSEKQYMEPRVLEYEPQLAMFVPEEDPLQFYRVIGSLSLHLLKSGGRLCFEINRAYGADTVQLLSGLGYQDVQLWQDISHNDRFVFAQR